MGGGPKPLGGRSRRLCLTNISYKDETETITDYIVMYQHQRKQQKAKIQVSIYYLICYIIASLFTHFVLDKF